MIFILLALQSTSVFSETVYMIDYSMLNNHNYNPKYDHYPWAYKKESSLTNIENANSNKQSRLDYLNRRYIELTSEATKYLTSEYSIQKYATKLAERKVVKDEMNRLNGITVIKEERRPLNCNTNVVFNSAYTTCN